MNNYVVIDLEMCNAYKSAMNREMNYRQELIQIGAVALNECYEVVDTFMTHVFPEFGTVDGFINRLTGISKEALRNAPSAQQALESFVAWLPQDAILVAWSTNDERQLQKECMRKQLEVPGLQKTFGTWTDCQQLFGQKLNTRKQYRLSEALSVADIYYDDGAHDALVDARNTAKLFAKLQREELFRFSPYFISANEESYCSFDPFAMRGKNGRCAVC